MEDAQFSLYRVYTLQTTAQLQTRGGFWEDECQEPENQVVSRGLSAPHHCSPWESQGDKKGQDWDVAAPAISLTEILVCGDKGTLPRLCHGEGLGLRWVSKTGTSEMRPGSWRMTSYWKWNWGWVREMSWGSRKIPEDKHVLLFHQLILLGINIFVSFILN